MEHLPKARLENIVVQSLEKETLIYDLNINKAFCLNETSALVWQLCDGQNSIAELSRLVSGKLKISVTEEFVWLALSELKKNSLLENPDLITAQFNGLSRREIVRKVGLASMVTLPVIASLVAPPAAQAQSRCVPDGDLCIFPRVCCSDFCNRTSTCGCVPDGDPCVFGSDCCNNFCIHFFCECIPAGEACESDAECCSGSCDNVNRNCLPF